MSPSTDLRCGRCDAELIPRAKFCPECGERVRSDDEGERRVVTVVFADLSGFTAYSEHTDPERVRALADEAAAGLGEIVRRYGGTVDKVIGDCVMAVFGAPVAHDDDPERAVRASLDMHRFVNDNQDRFERMPLRIGVNTGEVMFAPVAGTVTVIGDTVNTAARLQSAAARGEVMIGAGTARAVSGTIELEELEPIVAKGKGEPVSAWRAVAVLGETRRIVRRAPLVGRDNEVARVLELFETTVLEARPHLALVVGEPGLGKTRLIEHVTDRAAATAEVLTGRCLAYGEGITYWPVIELVRSAAGIAPEHPVAVVAAKLDTLLTSIVDDDADEARTIAGAVSHLLGVSTTPRGTYRVGEISRSELHWGLRRFFEVLARERPHVLVVEDLHWAEPTLLELLSFIADGASAPLLLLCSSRPELEGKARDWFQRASNRRIIRLDALDADAAEELLARLLGSDDVAGSHLLGLLRTVGGNPLFLHETVRMLSERGLLEPDGRLRAGVDAAELSVPDTIQALIDSRLDQLDDREQLVLGCASVLGHVFRHGELAALVTTAITDQERLSVADVDTVVARLAHRDFLRLSGEEVQFTHLLVRDAAYNRLAKRRRSELHQRCAAWMGGDGGDDVVEIVAYHYEQACLLGDEVGLSPVPLLAASRALMRSAERAGSREGTREASRFYERALALVEDRLPECETEIRLRRAQLHALMGNLPDATAALEGVLGVASDVGRDDLRCRALLDLAQLERATGRLEEARAHIVDGHELAAALGEDLLRIRAGFAVAAIRASLDGDVEAAVMELDQALDLARRTEDHTLEAQGHLQAGVLHYNAGNLSEAEAAFQRCADVGARDGSVRDQALATTFLGIIRRYRGSRDESEALLRRALSWLRRTSDTYVEVQARRALATVLLDRGALTEAEQLINETVPIAERFGGWLAADVYRVLADAHARAGRTGDAVIAAGAARELARNGDASAKAASWMAEAAVATAMRDPEIAAEAFTAAIALLETKGLVLDVADARLQAGRALAALGDLESAAEQLELAREAFRSLDAPAAVAEAEAALLEGAAVA